MQNRHLRKKSLKMQEIFFLNRNHYEMDFQRRFNFRLTSNVSNFVLYVPLTTFPSSHSRLLHQTSNRKCIKKINISTTYTENTYEFHNSTTLLTLSTGLTLQFRVEPTFSSSLSNSKEIKQKLSIPFDFSAEIAFWL